MARHHSPYYDTVGHSPLAAPGAFAGGGGSQRAGVSLKAEKRLPKRHQPRCNNHDFLAVFAYESST